MTSKTLLYLLVILLAGSLNGQSENQMEAPIGQPWTTSIGVNISNLFQKVTRFTSDSSLNNPYLFTGSLRKANRGYSLAIGGYYEHALDQEQGFADYRKTTNTDFVTRASYDFYRNFSKQWLAVISLDAVFGLNTNQEVTETGIDLVDFKSTITTYGAGPRLQLQFAATQSLALGMETYLHLRYQTEKSERTFRNFPGLDDKNENIRYINTQTILPLALFVHLKL